MLYRNKIYTKQEMLNRLESLECYTEQIKQQIKDLNVELSIVKTECQALHDKILSSRIVSYKNCVLIMYLTLLLQMEEKENRRLKKIIDKNVSDIRIFMEDHQS